MSERISTDSQQDFFLPNLSIEEAETVAITLLQAHCPPEGYHLAFSGGKDSCVIVELCKRAGVKFDKVHNNTTIDPPELVHFIKRVHPDCQWSNPDMPMMKAVAELPKVPPTRAIRWCCSMYKEHGGNGRVKVMGVRAAESKKRSLRWRHVAQDMHGNKTICPIVFWSTEFLWQYIRARNIPYCHLYNEPDIDRIGCVGCPLIGKERQEEEFKRWPRYEANWRRAIIANWTKWHAVPREDGQPRFQARFKTGEDFWDWWRNYDRHRAADLFREDCQSGFLWTNQPLEDNENEIEPDPAQTNPALPG